MRQEQVKKVFPDATEEQIKAMLDINSADIGKWKESAESLQPQLDEAKKTIAELEAVKSDATKLQEELDKYKMAEQQKAEAEQKKQARTALEQRFEAIAKGEFINEYTKSGILSDFEAALADNANTGKGDAEVYAAIIKDRDGIFKNPNPVPGMTGINQNATAPETITKEQFEKMGYKSRIELYNTNPELYDKLKGK